MITTTELAWRLGTALLLGGAIGLERERRDRPAGVRTHLLVALGAATVMIVSAHFAEFQGYDRERILRADPARIAEGVVVGLGFLGAGTIWGKGRGIKGLTTAAGLWLVAAVGLASGAGMFTPATISTVAALFVLVVVGYAEKYQRRQVCRRVILTLDQQSGPGRSGVLDGLRAAGAKVQGADYHFASADKLMKLCIDVRLRDDSEVEPLLARLEQMPGVRDVTIRR